MRAIFQRELAMGVKLQSKRPPSTVRGTPWALVGRYSFEEEVYYADLNLPFYTMEHSKRLETMVGRQRLARIQSRYQLRGKRHEYTIAEIGPWELVISRAVERTDPDGARGKSNLVVKRYVQGDPETGSITSILVWLSSIEAESGSIDIQ